MPRAHSVVLVLDRSTRRSKASSAAGRSPLRTAASISSGSTQPPNPSTSRSYARCAAVAASAYSPRPLCSTAVAHSAISIANPSPRALPASTAASRSFVRRFPIAAPGGEQDRGRDEVRAADCRADRLRFLQQLLCDAELAAEEPMRGGVAECERKEPEAAALARDATDSARDRFGDVVFPELQRELAGEQAPDEVLATESLCAKSRNGARHRCRLIPSRQSRDDGFQ